MQTYDELIKTLNECELSDVIPKTILNETRELRDILNSLNNDKTIVKEDILFARRLVIFLIEISSQYRNEGREFMLVKDFQLNNYTHTTRTKLSNMDASFVDFGRQIILNYCNIENELSITVYPLSSVRNIHLYN